MVSKYQKILDWLNLCPKFSNLDFINCDMNSGDNIIIPFGTSQKQNINGYIDVNGNFYGDIKPIPLIYEEYQIQCFRFTNPNENNYNILTYDDIQEVINWIGEQDNLNNLPDIDNVIAVESVSFMPQVAGRDMETGIFKYFFTLRIYYKNLSKGRCLDEC